MTQITDKVWAAEVPDDLLSPEFCFEQSIGHMLDGEEGDDELVIRHRERTCGSPIRKITIILPPGTWRFLFTTKTATEEDARKVVTEIHNYHPETLLDEIFAGVSVDTHLESLASLLRSKGLDTENNFALIEKMK